MTDKYDDLTGADLDNAFTAAHGPTEGGSNQDGTLNADEKRDYLRNHGTGDDSDQSDRATDVDDTNRHSLTDDQRAQAQALPVPRELRDQLTRAHADADLDRIASVTQDINDYREQQFADSLRG